MKIDKKLLYELASRAKIEISEENFSAIQEKVGHVLGWLGEIENAKLESDDMFYHHGLSHTVLRADEVKCQRADLVELAPRRNNRLILVPRIIGKS